MENILVSFAPALLPSIILLLLVLKRTEYRKRVVLVFATGYFAAIPALLLAVSIPVPTPVIRAYLAAGLVEETVKLLLILVATPKSGGRTPVAAAAGMGFAGFENLLTPQIPSILLLRSVTALPLHLATCLIMARLVDGRANQLTRSEHSFGLWLGTLSIGVVIHGTYDLSLFLPPPFPLFVVPMSVSLMGISFMLLRQWWRESSSG
jgi:RsiW-degrading membrane proteinase PrsW (M82 family)